MESMFQNCVTEFDLNLFGERTDVNQATTLTQCSTSRKLSIARVKERVKGVSQVVQRANNTNEVLIETQKELLETKQDLEGARNLIFEKNEQYKAICDERTTYFKQTEEYSKEIQNLKEQLKNFSEIDFGTKLKDQIINGYSEQIKGLQVEMEKLRDDKKDSERSSSFALKQARASKNMAEKRLARVLKEYILPTIKKRDRWLRKTIKKYLPEVVQEEDEEVDEELKEVEKITESGENQEYANLNKDDSSGVNPIRNRNTSVDFDNVGSIDTGRGSSLALSDGEKSFHSPDYYMHNSPPCIVQSIGTSDVSTSPIIFEKSDVDHNNATITCNNCAQLSKKDSCTSPIPLLNLEKRVPPTDSFNSEECNLITDQSLENSEIYHKKEMISSCVDKSMKDSCNTIQEPNIKTSPTKSQDFTFDSDDDNGVMSNDSDCSSPVEELKALFPVDCPEAVTKSQIIKTNESGNTLAKTKNNTNRYDADNSTDTFGSGSLAASPCNIQTPSMGSVIIQTTKISESGEEVESNVNTLRKSSLFSPTGFDNSLPKSIDIEIQRSPAVALKPPTPRNPENNNKKIHQEQECLELNNSSNIHDDTETNIEVSEILNKMRLHRLMTPIPSTPPRREVLSPTLSLVNLNTQAKEMVKEAINEQLNVFTTNMQQVMASFMNNMPPYLGQISRILSLGNLNEDLLRNLLTDPNKKDSLNENLPTSQIENHPSCNVNPELHNKLQPDVVDLNTGTMLCIGESDNADYTGSDYVVMEEDTDTEIATIQNINGSSSNSIDAHNKKHSKLEKNTMPNTSVDVEVATGNAMLPKTDESVILEAIPSADLGIAHKRAQHLFCKAIGDDNNSQNIVVNVNKNTSSSAMESRCSIVYESAGISDEDGETRSTEIPVEDHPTGTKRKAKKLSKLQSLRIKMKPKPKIKNDVTTSVRKLSAKPVPTNMAMSKKKVTEFDNAASLNEKSVYEKAVKVVASLRLTKQPRLILSDCVKSKYETKVTEKNNEDKKSDKLPTVDTKNNKGKISDNLSKVPETNTFDVIGTNTSKIIHTPLDKPITTNHSTDITPQKSSGIERNNTKRSYNLRNSIDTREIKEATRKSISFSEYDIRNNNANTSRKESRNSVDTRGIKETIRKRISFSECDTRNDNTITSDKESRNSIDTRGIKETIRKRISFSECDTRNDNTNTSDKESRNSIDTRETKRKKISFSEYDTRNDNANTSDKESRNSIDTREIKETKRKRISFSEYDTPRNENANTSNKESRKSVDTREINETKRKGISVSEYDTRNDNDNASKQESVSPKILRSSPRSKSNNKSEPSHIISPTRAGLRSRIGQNNTVIDEIYSGISMGRKCRTARQILRKSSEKINDETVQAVDETDSEKDNDVSVASLGKKSRIGENHTIRNSGNADSAADSLSSTVSNKLHGSDTSKKNINKSFSKTNCNLLFNENTSDKKLSENKLATEDTLTFSLGRKRRIAHQNTHNTAKCTNIGEQSSKEENRVVSYADLNVFTTTENTQDQIDNHSKGVTDEAENMSKISRLTRNTTTRNSNSTVIDDIYSGISMGRIVRQNSRKHSEKNNVEMDQTVHENDSEKDDDVSIATLVRKSRTGEKNTILSSGKAESAAVTLCSTVSDKLPGSDTSKKYSNKGVRKENCNQLFMENTSDKEMGENKLETEDTLTVSLGRNRRIAQQNTHNTAKFTNIGEKSSKEENSRVVSYAELNLFTTTDNTQEQIDNHSKGVTDEAENMSKISRLTRNRTRNYNSTVGQNNTVIDDIYSGTSMGRKCRIARQNSRKCSEKNNYETDQTVDENDSEKDDDISIASLVRKSRTAEKNTILSSGKAESAAVTLCSTVSNKLPGSDTSKKYSNKGVPKENCNLLFNENTSDKKMDENKLETEDTLTVSLGRHCRIARQNSHNTAKCTDTEEQSSNVPNISKEENSRVVTYADLNLFTTTENTEDQIEKHTKSVEAKNMSKISRLTRSATTRNSTSKKDNEVCYDDLNMFSNEDTKEDVKTLNRYSKDSLLCRMIEKYGVQKHKFIAKKPSESKVNEIAKRLETRLSEIIEGPHEEYQKSMKRLVAEIRDWNIKDFILGFIKFLKNPERKLELFNKSTYPPCPPMTKKEQVLLYVLDELQKLFDYRNIVNKILMNIEYTLFAINKAGESYDVIEAISHFYALLCRNYQKLSQLRLFIIDAMYCLQLKSVILVQQCLEVWMSVLPLGHMGIAKSPLVTCLVYLLHFYKCDDKFNRVQNIRNTLRWKYNYDLNDWNEKKILEMFRTAILEIREAQAERKTLRLSLLILAKRHGAKWCHTNIVKNMLQPLINDSATSDGAKRFCLSLLGPLLKPYPANMKVHYEMVIDYLMDMLLKKNSLKMQEAIISSLIYIDKNNNRFHQFLAKWAPEQVSPEFYLVFRDYIKSKTVHNWKQILTWKIN